MHPALGFLFGSLPATRSRIEGCGALGSNKGGLAVAGGLQVADCQDILEYGVGQQDELVFEHFVDDRVIPIGSRGATSIAVH
jgi:hypothetical protein